MTTLTPVREAAVRQMIDRLSDGHRREDVDAYLAVIDSDTVWVTSRGQCFRSRVALGDYLRHVIADGLGQGSVRYTIESVHPVSTDAAAVVVEQIYPDAGGGPQDRDARHTLTYVVAERDGVWRVVAGQNTMRR